jgi:predicted ATP-binding protein involved in virulence
MFDSENMNKVYRHSWNFQRTQDVRHRIKATTTHHVISVQMIDVANFRFTVMINEMEDIIYKFRTK